MNKKKLKKIISLALVTAMLLGPASTATAVPVSQLGNIKNNSILIGKHVFELDKTKESVYNIDTFVKAVKTLEDENDKIYYKLDGHWIVLNDINTGEELLDAIKEIDKHKDSLVQNVQVRKINGIFILETPENYSQPEKGSSNGTTKIQNLNMDGIYGATKWQIKVQEDAIDIPVLDSTVEGTVDYNAGEDIKINAGQHLVLLAVDDSGKVKGYTDLVVSEEAICCDDKEVTINKMYVDDKTGNVVISGVSDSINQNEIALEVLDKDQNIVYFGQAKIDDHKNFTEQFNIDGCKEGEYKVFLKNNKMKEIYIDTFEYKPSSNISEEPILNNNLSSNNKSLASNTESIKEEEWNGEKKIAKPLVVLMEYPDYNHEKMKDEETPRDFKDWSKKHYQDMLFGDTSYEGPKGEQLFTMKQYYEQQSGGSFTIDGGIAGWYTAKHNADYYGKVGYRGEHDSNVKPLIKEALDNAAQDSNINLSEYDVKDPLDMDMDDNYDEPDGVIDYLIVVHSGKGEETGGGTLGNNAIWSHRDTVNGSMPYFKTDAHGNRIGISDYMIVPQDAGIGVFAHEYGHVLGLPDEYNIVDSEKQTPIGYWSIMASGSWAGVSSGADPTGFSPWCKQYLQNKYNGNWLNETVLDLDQINEEGLDFLLDEASKKVKNKEIIRINLPKEENEKDRYYLLEWRSNEGTDKGLEFTEGGRMSYDSGLVIWYVDENYLEKDRNGMLTGYKDNDVKSHPGYGFIGVVDADQNTIQWKETSTGETAEIASSTYHVHDAAFSLRKTKDMYADNMKNKPGKSASDDETYINPIFDDSKKYFNKDVPEAGRILPEHGLKIYVTGESKDRSVGKIHIFKSQASAFSSRKDIKEDDSTSSFIKNISVDSSIVDNGGKVIVTVETEAENLAKEAYLSYAAKVNGEEVQKKVMLQLKDGKYIGEIHIGDNFEIGTWEPRFIVLEDNAENVQIIYNTCIYADILGNSANKEDLSVGNFKVVEEIDTSNFTAYDLSKQVKFDKLISKNQFELGKTADIKVNAVNEAADSQGVTLITGLFDENNKLIKYYSKKEIIDSQKIKEIDSKINLNAEEYNGKYTIKVFLWDDISSMNILSDDMQFNVIEDIKVPEYKEAVVNNNKVELIFDEMLLDNTQEQLSDLKSAILFKDGIGAGAGHDSFTKLTQADSVKIVHNKLIIDFNTALQGDLNQIKISADALKDKLGNKIPEIITEEIKAVNNYNSQSIKYANAKNIEEFKVLLDGEPAILGLDTMEYKTLSNKYKLEVAFDLFISKFDFKDNEIVQNLLDEAVAKEVKLQKKEEAEQVKVNSAINKLEILEHFMSQNWVINENNIEEAERLLREALEELDKVNKESREKLEKDSKYNFTANKRIIENARKEINNKLEELKKYINAENPEQIKLLVDAETNILGLSLSEYKGLNEEQKVFVSKYIYDNKDNLTSKGEIQNILNAAVEKSKALGVDAEVLKYRNAESAEAIRALLDAEDNALGLNTNIYNKLEEYSKMQVANVLYKNKAEFTKKEIIQNKLNKEIAEVYFTLLEEEFWENYKLEEKEVIERMEAILANITEALNTIEDENEREEIVDSHYDYENIKSEVEKARNKLNEKLQKIEITKYTNAENAEAIKMLLDAETNALGLDTQGYKALDEVGKTAVAKELYDNKVTLSTKVAIQTALNTAVQKASAPKVTKKDFEEKVMELDEIVSYEDLTDKTQLEEAERILKEGEEMINALKGTEEYDRIPKYLLNMYETFKQDVEDARANFDKELQRLKISKYTNAENIEAIKILLDAETNALGVDTQGYKALNEEAKSAVAKELYDSRASLTTKEAIQTALNTAVQKASAAKVTKEDFEEKVMELDEIVSCEDLTDKTQLEKAERILKEAEEILNALKGTEEYNGINSNLMTYYQMLKQDVENARAEFDKQN